jgi:hypothetical protein
MSNIHLITSKSEPTSIKFEQDVGDSVAFCGEILKLPRLFHLLTKVKPKFFEGVSNIVPGQDVFIEWVPEPDCEHVIDIVAKE